MNELSGPVKDAMMKDFPKIYGQPRPQEPLVWTTYLVQGKMRARIHLRGKFNEGVQCDAEMQDPLGFCEIVDTFRGIK